MAACVTPASAARRSCLAGETLRAAFACASPGPSCSSVSVLRGEATPSAACRLREAASAAADAASLASTSPAPSKSIVWQPARGHNPCTNPWCNCCRWPSEFSDSAVRSEKVPQVLPLLLTPELYSAVLLESAVERASLSALEQRRTNVPGTRASVFIQYSCAAGTCNSAANASLGGGSRAHGAWCTSATEP